jgi:galactose mutarotase-like enzyme
MVRFMISLYKGEVSLASESVASPGYMGVPFPMIQLKNDRINASIDPLGAELKSLKLDGKEYLWQGSPDSWNASSPQLFPIIGKALPRGWEYEGKTFTMDNHGFARKSVFDIVEKTEDSCLLRLKDSSETQKAFPFAFILDISYTLKGSALLVSYSVKNPESRESLFSIGAHPGFNCPLSGNTAFGDYYLEFNKEETISRRYKDEYLSGESSPVIQSQKRLGLDHSLFDRGAIILSGLESDRVTLKSDKSPSSVTMDFTGFPDFGIWTMAGKKAPYVCLEPWFGVDSTVGDSADFNKKEGLVRLKGKEDFSCSYSLTLT